MTVAHRVGEAHRVITLSEEDMRRAVSDKRYESYGAVFNENRIKLARYLARERKDFMPASQIASHFPKLLTFVGANAPKSSSVATINARLLKGGSLSLRDLGVVVDMMALHVPKAKPDTIDASAMRKAFDTAQQNGTNTPQLAIGPFTFKVNRPGDRPGIYVFHGRVGFCGRMIPYGTPDDPVRATFSPVDRIPETLHTELKTILADPKKAAVAHGGKTGVCSCCRRKLTDPVSIANGIGPVCGRRWFS